MNAKASTAPGMSGVNPGKRPSIVRLQKYLIACTQEVRLPRYFAGAAETRPHQGEHEFGAPVAAVRWAWHLGTQSSQAGNHGYPGSEQARPAFAVLTVVAAAAATIALASRAQARGPAKRPREADPSGADQ